MDDNESLRAFHLWYYGAKIPERTTYLGVKCLKCPLDLWNYQEIIYDLKPALILEFGAYHGGATLFFSYLLSSIVPDGTVISVEPNARRVDPRVTARHNVRLLPTSSLDPIVSDIVRRVRAARKGPIFAILDSLHTRDHVLQEMEVLRQCLVRGDYLVVEDTNMNGHPVCPELGPGPMEAVEQYQRLHPGEYVHDSERSLKFGLTFAPLGYLRRT